MDFNLKYYKTQKIKNYMKKKNFFFYFNGVNKNSLDWIQTEQKLKQANFSFHMVLNKITLKELNCSKFKKTLCIINSSTFFLETDLPMLKKQVLLNNFELLFFFILAVKLNNKLYSFDQLKKTHSILYKKNNSLVNQFFTKYLKKYWEKNNI